MTLPQQMATKVRGVLEICMDRGSRSVIKHDTHHISRITGPSVHKR